MSVADDLDLPWDGSDDLDLPWDAGTSQATRNGAKGRRCRRHEWSFATLVKQPDGTFSTGETCHSCGVLRNPAASRRGRTSLRAGKDAERAIAKSYGGTRTGQFGGPDDVMIGDLFVVQSKAGARFPGWMWDELAKLPRTGGRIPTLIVSDRPGPGRPTRRIVVRMMADDLDLHGGAK